MGDGFSIISTEYESRLKITAQQELRPPIPNPGCKTDTDTLLLNQPARKFKIIKEHSPLYTTR
jgi:hypothetical protein